MLRSDALFTVPIARLAEAIRYLPWRLPNLTLQDATLIERGLAEVARSGANPLEQLPGFAPPFRFTAGEWDAPAVAQAALSVMPVREVMEESGVERALDLLAARLLRGGRGIDPLFLLGGRFIPGVGVRSRLAYGVDGLPSGCAGMKAWRSSYWRRSTLAAIRARGATPSSHWAIHLLASEASALCQEWPSGQGALLAIGPFGRRWAPFKDEGKGSDVLADMAAGAKIWPPLPETEAAQVSRPDPDIEAKALHDWLRIPNLTQKAAMEPSPIRMDRVEWPK